MLDKFVLICFAFYFAGVDGRKTEVDGYSTADY